MLFLISKKVVQILPALKINMLENVQKRNYSILLL
jgi:hypothetical protein